MELTLDMIQTVGLGVIVLFFGNKLRNKVGIFEKYCIPAPVIGGILFSMITLIGHYTGALSFVFDDTLKSVLMTAFFTTVGFTASLKLLKKGGTQVFIFLACAVALVVLQDVIGVALAKVFNLNPLIGMSTASVPMTGGHGTSGSFAPLFEEHGAKGATTIAMAAATFGLVMGSMIGGPIGKSLIEKHNLVPKEGSKDSKENLTQISEEETITSHGISMAVCQIIIAMAAGTILSKLLTSTGMTFPPYIGAMFAAAIMRNIADVTNTYEIKTAEIDVLGGNALSLFLAMALMGLKLWELAELAGPLVSMLLAQTLLMAVFAYYVTFNAMGRDYEAAIMASGHCGFGMGATPNAMANMQALSGKFMPAPRAFFILPLVGSLFIDFINAAVITGFMNFFS